MKKIKLSLPIFQKFLCIVFVLGLLSTVFLLIPRFNDENAYKEATVIMEYADALALGKAEDVLPSLREMGVSAMIFGAEGAKFSLDDVTSAVDFGFKIIFFSAAGGDNYAQMNELDKSHLFPLFLGDSMEFDPALVADSGFSVGLVENRHQLSFDPILGFISGDYSGPMVRVFKLLSGFQRRYAILGYDGPQEIENIFYRGLSERGIRVIWLKPFIHSQTLEVITDLDEYTEVFSSLQSRLEPHGIVLGDGFSSITPRSDGSYIFVFLALSALLTLLFIRFWPFPKVFAVAFFLICAAASLGVLYLNPGFALIGGGFLAALLFPCTSVIILFSFFKQSSQKSPIYMFFLSLLPTLLGTIFIGALFSGPQFLLENAYFRGVKVAVEFPLIFALILSVFFIIREFRHKKVSFSFSFKKVLLLMFVLILIGGALFLLFARSGHGMISVSQFEERFRIFLELVLPVRPRTKEFLVGIPSLILSIFFLRRREKLWFLIFAPFSAIAFASIINTFCHSRSAFYLSVWRTGIGLLMGVLIGFIAVLVFKYAILPLAKNQKPKSS